MYSLLYNKLEIIASFLLSILFTVGILSHTLGLESLMLSLTEGFILFCNCVVTGFLVWTSRTGKPRDILTLISALVIISCITLGIEIYGVATGKIFGVYTYGSVFRLHVFDVPWIIGWNWVLIIIGCTLIARDCISYILARAQQFLQVTKNTQQITEVNQLSDTHTHNHKNKLQLQTYHLDKTAISHFLAQYPDWAQVLINISIAAGAGILAVIFDYALEPVAIHYKYWIWENNIVPLQNYQAWFTITFLTSLLILRLNIRFESKLIKDYIIYQYIFFVGLVIYTYL